MDRVVRAYATGVLASGMDSAEGRDIQLKSATEIANAAKANVAAVKKQLG